MGKYMYSRWWDLQSSPILSKVRQASSAQASTASLRLPDTVTSAQTGSPDGVSTGNLHQ